MKRLFLLLSLTALPLLADVDLNKLPLAQWSDAQKQENPTLFLKRLQFEQKDILFKLREFLEKQESEALRLKYESDLTTKSIQKSTEYLKQLVTALKANVFPAKIGDVSMTKKEIQAAMLSVSRDRERMKLRLKDITASLETVQNQIVLKQKDYAAQQRRVDRTAEFIQRLEQKGQIVSINNALLEIEKSALVAAEQDERNIDFLNTENVKAEGQKDQDDQELDKLMKEFK